MSFNQAFLRQFSSDESGENNSLLTPKKCRKQMPQID